MAKRGNGSEKPPTYGVGYGKPPVHSRFKPGQSGNPAGRRKGSRNLSTDVRFMLELPVRVQEGGRTRKISTQEAFLMKLREKALRGDVRALGDSIELASRFNDDSTVAQTSQALPAEDQAILAAYVAGLRGTDSADTGDNAKASGRKHRRK